MIKEFEYLKQEFPNKYISIVLEHKAVNKVLTFCDDKNQYLLFTGMFSEVNGGKGITDDLESYLVNFLVDKYKAKAFGRAAAFVLEDQTTFIGFDFKSIENDIWSQQNNFSVDEEGKVIDVDKSVGNSSDQNSICAIVNSYFEKIDFPEDTQNYLNNLYEQVKPSFDIVKLKK
ncbi:MAG: hypothetical protein ACJZ18_05725 [Methylophilaceae bacterium]|tara:strand:- start:187 stop:705 length:519 start_codon:yes stop_codon:yes gene_type:complete